MIQYTCQHCNASLETEDSLGMTNEECPICRKSNLVPPSRAQCRRHEAERRNEARRIEDQHRQQEAARRAEAEKLEKQRQTEIQEQYLVEIARAKADPSTPKTWYCSHKGAERGPMQESLVQRWLDDGQLGPDDCVRTEDSTQWIRIRDIPERFYAKPQRSAPTPPLTPAAAAKMLRCPKCGGTQIAANKRGMKGSSACCGALLFGPLGLLCGLSGANTVIVTCLQCGHQWKRG